MKRISAVFLICVLLTCLLAPAQALTTKGTEFGTMRVVNCKEWVSLREEPDQRAERLEKVPLGELVYECVKDEGDFVYCQYEGTWGYILIKYLEQVPEVDTADALDSDEILPAEELLNTGNTVLDWTEGQIHVVASREYVSGGTSEAEILRVGCYMDGEAVWGYNTLVPELAQLDQTKAFIGGTAIDPQVMVYNAMTGLTMLDMYTGEEKWTLSSGVCSLGDAFLTAVADDGTMYIAGTDGPWPVAISVSGNVLWQSRVNNSQVYAPYEITLEMEEIDVKYKSGMDVGYILAAFEYTGDLIGLTRYHKD